LSLWIDVLSPQLRDLPTDGVFFFLKTHSSIIIIIGCCCVSLCRKNTQITPPPPLFFFPPPPPVCWSSFLCLSVWSSVRTLTRHILGGFCAAIRNQSVTQHCASHFKVNVEIKMTTQQFSVHHRKASISPETFFLFLFLFEPSGVIFSILHNFLISPF